MASNGAAVGALGAGRGFCHDLYLHQIHGCAPSAPSDQQAPGSLPQAVVQAAAQDPSTGLYAAAQAMAYAFSRQDHQVHAGSLWRVTLGPTYLSIGFRDPSFKEVLRIPLFFCNVVYSAVPGNRQFNRLDPRTWPVFAVGLPVRRIAPRGFEPTSQVPSPVSVAQNGSTFLVSACCDGSAFHSLLAIFSSRGALRQDIYTIAEVTDTVLGTGAAGAVMLANNVNDEEEFFALKVHLADADCEENKQRLLESFAMEAALTFAAGKHPNLIRCHGVFLNGPENKLSMLLDCHALGDLKDYVNTYGTFPPADSAEKFAGLLSGLVQLHTKGIVHRDIKPENLLISSLGDLVLTDFGVSCYVGDEQAMQMRCGSLGHVGPEILDEQPYDCKVDVFGAGVVLYYLYIQILPFRGKSQMSRYEKNRKAEVKMNHPVLEGLCKKAQSFLLALLARCPDQRPSSRQAMRMMREFANTGHQFTPEVASIEEESPQQLTPRQMQVESTHLRESGADEISIFQGIGKEQEADSSSVSTRAAFGRATPSTTLDSHRDEPQGLDLPQGRIKSKSDSHRLQQARQLDVTASRSCTPGGLSERSDMNIDSPESRIAVTPTLPFTEESVEQWTQQLESNADNVDTRRLASEYSRRDSACEWSDVSEQPGSCCHVGTVGSAPSTQEMLSATCCLKQEDLAMQRKVRPHNTWVSTTPGSDYQAARQPMRPPQPPAFPMQDKDRRPQRCSPQTPMSDYSQSSGR